MSWTTPPEKDDQHKSWHVFHEGGCGWCGWHCDDCPIGVDTCKCNFSKEETAEKRADELLNLENRGITDSWVE